MTNITLRQFTAGAASQYWSSQTWNNLDAEQQLYP